jgi:hypothetical protein
MPNIRACDDWPVEKHLLTFRCGHAMLLPILEQVAINPVKANAFGNCFIGIHGSMYMPNIYNCQQKRSNGQGVAVIEINQASMQKPDEPAVIRGKWRPSMV